MGFLSKLFGGDAGAASGKTADDPSSASAELESSVAMRTPVNTGGAAPASTDKPADKTAEKTAEKRAPASRQNVPASAGSKRASSEFTSADAAKPDVATGDSAKNDAPRSDAAKQDAAKQDAKDGARVSMPSA